MKSKKISSVALLLVAFMLTGVFASCRNDEPIYNETQSDSDSTSISKEMTNTELKVTDTESEGTDTEPEDSSDTTVATDSEASNREFDETVELGYSGNTSDIIELGSSLSNKV